MTIEKVREMIHAQPFAPFIAHLADGRKVSINHPDFVSSSQTGRNLHVSHGPGDASSFIDVVRVADLELKSSPRGKRR
jgi:hypothetical protein